MKELEKLQEARKRLDQCIRDEYREEAAQAISDLLSAQAQSDIEEVAVCVPLKGISQTLDLGPVALSVTNQGILFQAKGSMSVVIDPRQQYLYREFSNLIKLANDDFKSDDVAEEDVEALQTYLQAWLYLLQAPLFVAGDPGKVLSLSAELLKMLNERAAKANEALQPETPEADAAFANAMEGLEAKPEPKKRTRKAKKQ